MSEIEGASSEIGGHATCTTAGKWPDAAIV